MPAKKKVTKKKVAKKAATEPKVPLFSSCAQREKWEKEHAVQEDRT